MMQSSNRPEANRTSPTTSGSSANSETANSASGSEPRVAPLAYAAMYSAVPIVFFPFLFPVPGVLGFLALRQIAQHDHYVGTIRAYFAIAWSVLGALLCVLLALILMNP
jgi:hypothetical protein